MLFNSIVLALLIITTFTRDECFQAEENDEHRTTSICSDFEFKFIEDLI